MSSRLSGRVGKHTDSLARELVASTEGKTNCKEWDTDGWGGYERVLRNDEGVQREKVGSGRIA